MSEQFQEFLRDAEESFLRTFRHELLDKILLFIEDAYHLGLEENVLNKPMQK